MLTTVVNHNIEQPKPQSIRPIIHARLTIYVLGLAQSPLLFARLSLGVRDRILSRTRIFFYYYSRYNLPNSQPIIHDFYIVVMELIHPTRPDLQFRQMAAPRHIGSRSEQ